MSWGVRSPGEEMYGGSPEKKGDEGRVAVFPRRKAAVAGTSLHCARACRPLARHAPSSPLVPS